MAPAPTCPLCFCLYFEERKPITITCGHTLCKMCLEKMIRDHKMQLKCPLCNQYYDEPQCRALLNIKPNISIQDVMDNLKTHCWLHGALGEKVCITCVQALCGNCTGHDDCEKLTIAEDFEAIRRALDKKLRKLHKQTPLPPDLANRIKKALDMSLSNFLKLCTEVHTHLHGPDLSNPREAILEEGKKDLRRIHSCLLSQDLLGRWKTSPDSLSDCQRLIKDLSSFAGVGIESEDTLPDVVCCMSCLQTVPKACMDMIMLPCFQVYHVICRPCAETQVASGHVVCPLDGRSFKIESIGKLSAFAPPPSTKDGSRLTPYPAKDFFGYAHYVDLFKHVMPAEKLPADRRIGNCRGYTVDFSVNQVEAISFLTFTDVTIGGIGIANPVEADEQVTVEWVKIYTGDEAMSLPRLQTLAFPRVLTGAHGVLTNLLFQEEFQAVAMATYTIKVKLTGQKPDNKMLFYRGNHLTRNENPQGSKEDLWDFVDTLGFDRGERGSSRLYIAGPILRVIYR